MELLLPQLSLHLALLQAEDLILLHSAVEERELNEGGLKPNIYRHDLVV